jgi:hypothetical protein
MVSVTGLPGHFVPAPAQYVELDARESDRVEQVAFPTPVLP